MNRTARACLLIVCAAAISCANPYGRDVTAVVSGATTVAVGGSVQLNVRLDYSHGGTLLLGPSNMGSVSWTTSDAAIARVERGLVTGVSPGAVTITATPGITATGSGQRFAGTHQMTVQ